jgi:hypothetical protein
MSRSSTTTPTTVTTRSGRVVHPSPVAIAARRTASLRGRGSRGGRVRARPQYREKVVTAPAIAAAPVAAPAPTPAVTPVATPAATPAYAAYLKIDRLFEEIRELPSINLLVLLDLQCQITGATDYFDINYGCFRTIVGPTVADEFSSFQNTIVHPRNDDLKKYVSGGQLLPFDPAQDYDAAAEEFEYYLYQRRADDIQTKRAARVLKKFIDDRASRLSADKEAIARVEALVAAAHNPALVSESRVYHLYSDGEITNQKGGPIYQCRTEHRSCASLILPPLKFPISLPSGKFTYAIVTERDAHQLRNEMSRLTETTTNAPVDH